jgi:hypothetical protein
LQEAEVLTRPLGRTKSLASLLNVLAEMYRQRGDIEASRAHREEAMAVAGDVGHWLGYAAARANQIDDTFHDDGNVEAAIAEMKELVDQLRQRKSLALLGLALFLFGDYLLAADRISEARAIRLEGIRLNQSLARSAPVNACLETLALAAALAAANDRAARLAGYVKAFCEKVGFHRDATQQNTWDRLIGILGAQLPPGALARLMAEGEVWSEDHAVSEATNV